MKPISADPAIHISIDESNTNGILGSYVDYIMFGLGTGLKSVVDKIRHNFYWKSLEWDKIDFLRLREETKNCGDGGRYLEIHQPDYLRKLEEMPNYVFLSDKDQ